MYGGGGVLSKRLRQRVSGEIHEINSEIVTVKISIPKLLQNNRPVPVELDERVLVCVFENK